MYKVTCYTIIFTLFSLTSFEQEVTNKTRLNIDTSKIAIFYSNSNTDSLVNFFYNTDHTKGLQLTNDDMGIINKLISKQITKYNASKDSTIIPSEINGDDSIVVLDIINLDKYKRQYIPFYDDKGIRMVLVNSFCEKDLEWQIKFGINWKKELVITNDGGDCYFLGLIDLDNKSLKYLSFNASIGGYLHKPRQ